LALYPELIIGMNAVFLNGFYTRIKTTKLLRHLKGAKQYIESNSRL
jgi:hypothetical protein